MSNRATALAAAAHLALACHAMAQPDAAISCTWMSRSASPAT